MSSRRSHLILIGLIGAALVGVLMLAVPGSPMHKKATLGLDLQGGLEVVLKAVPPKGRKLTSSDLDRSVTIIRNRIDKLGVAEPVVAKQGSDQISIQLAGVRDIRRATELIGKTAQLEFYDLEVDLVPPSISQGQPVAATSLYSLLSRVQSEVKGSKAEQWYLFKDKKLVAGPAPTREAVLNTKKAKQALSGAAQEGILPSGKKAKARATGELPKGFKVFGVPEKTTVITCGTGADVCPGAFPVTGTYFYLFKYQPNDAQHPIPEMTGNDLKLSGTRQDFDPNTHEPVVLMQFTGKGSKKFGDITAEEARRGRLRSSISGQDQFQHFAIVLDREIKSFPQIDFNENPNGITGSNGAQITGIGSIGEAKDLALVLQTGALPVEFVTAEQTTVSATLGKDSLTEAWHAAIAGLLVVALFLLLFYRFLGLVAVIGLGIYAAFLYGALLLFNVTLTLPGFAGMILTIGVAADANVVVFERIKEEFRAGKSIRAAIAAGYAKGFHTIIDANVVTAITALVLFAVASAGVKGFALMLLIGTLISLVTAVAATRAMLGLLAGFRWFDNPRFMGAQGQQGARWLQIDFMARRYLWFAISGTVILIAIASLATKGLNLGIDFKGGTQVTFATPQPVQLDDLRARLRALVPGVPVIQGRGNQIAGGYKNFQVRTESLTRTEETQVRSLIEDRFNARSVGVKNVSASFGRQIARGALLAIAFSLLLIVLYISVRFDFKFAGPVIVALAHDVVITVGIYSLTGREVTTSTVAAVLTVLGYSIYDTIIIFDRIRENVPLMRRASFARIANVSLWETIRRSLATTFITLLPVSALLLFGGDTLKDFAFALLVGIGSGAYSSIFIAAPLLTMWKEREPEFKRRIGAEEDGRGDGAVTVEEATQIAAAQPAPEVAPLPERSADARRERRRQRRRARPHGRAR
jgi:SecD/SecF fusion protein